MRRPHEVQWRERVFHSSALLWIPEAIMRKPMTGVTTSSARTCRSRLILRGLFPSGGGGNTRTTRVRVRLEVEVAAAAVGDVRVQLGRGEIGVPEHLLDAAQVGAPFEQVGREGVAQDMGGEALREAGTARARLHDLEQTGPLERPAVMREQEVIGRSSASNLGTTLGQPGMQG